MAVKRAKMSIVTGFKVVALILLFQEVCEARHADIPVSVPKHMCEPCHGQVLPVQQTNSCQKPLPKPIEVANEVVGELNISLRNAQEHVLKERKLLQHMYDIPDNFPNLVNIDGLRGIEHSRKFKKLLDKRLKPRKILQVIYIRTLLLSAYTDALGEIYKQNNRSLSDSLQSITVELRTIACTTVGFLGNLGLKQIKSKLTKRLCSYKKKIDGNRRTDYETSILWHGNQLLQDSIEDLNNLVNVTNECRFKKCKIGGKLKLKCKKEKRLRINNGLGKNRKESRNLKNKKDRKNKKDKKNNTDKNNKKDRKNRKKRKNKGNKKKDISKKTRSKTNHRRRLRQNRIA